MSPQFSEKPLSSGTRVIGFIVITDAERARAFYCDKLGLRFVRSDRFALVLDSNGIMIRAAIAPSVTPPHFTVLGWEVDDMVAKANALRAAGITLEALPGRAQDEFGIWTAPDGSQVAWFKDPDGNWLSISKHAASNG